MFAITKLGRESQEFISGLISTNTSRSKEASIALARVLICQIELPSAPVEDVSQFYRTQHQMELDQTINMVNELVVLDLQAVSDYCMKFYQYRYQTLHMSCHVLSLKKETAIVDFFRISKVFDEESLKVIEANPVRIAELVNRFNNLLGELKGS